MAVKIEMVKQTEVKKLKAISEIAFTETFAKDNTPADLAAFLAQNYNYAQLEKELANQNSFFYFIYQQNELAGYLKLNINEAQSEAGVNDALEIERIYILAAFKRQGLGQELIVFAEKVAQAQNKRQLWLGVWEYNLPAITFYKKMGFVKTGEHIFTLGSDDQTDWIMSKRINDKSSGGL